MGPPLQTPPGWRAAEAEAARRALARELSGPVALGVWLRAAADLGPLQVRTRQGARPATAEIAVVEQAIVSSIATRWYFESTARET